MEQKGFTLVEAMMTVLIIGIIGAIAYPSYLKQVVKSGRSDAKVALNEAAQRMQRCFTANGKFNPDEGACTVLDSLNSDDGLASDEGFYTLSVSGLAASTYKITATPVAGKRQSEDEDCISFSINQAGVKTAKKRGGADNTSVCW